MNITSRCYEWFGYKENNCINKTLAIIGLILLEYTMIALVVMKAVS